jgi:hypothetical protein
MQVLTVVLKGLRPLATALRLRSCMTKPLISVDETEQLCEILDLPAICAGVTPEVIIRLQRPPGAASVILGRTMMPIVTRGEGVLQGLTCQSLTIAWGYRPSGQLDIPSKWMCT